MEEKSKHRKQRKIINELGTGYITKTGVMGLLQRDGKIKVEVIGQAHYQENIQPVVRHNVSNEATIITDGFAGYKGLYKEFKAHEVVNHGSDEFVRGQFHTNSVEGFFSHLKRGIYGIYHNVSPYHLSQYCTEFAFRYNKRDLKDCEKFNLSLQNITHRLTYKGIIQPKKNK